MPARPRPETTRDHRHLPAPDHRPFTACRVHMTARTLVLVPDGDITITADRCLRAAASEIRTGVAHVQLDLTRVPWMDDYGPHFLDHLAQRCSAVGATLEISGLGEGLEPPAAPREFAAITMVRDDAARAHPHRPRPASASAQPQGAPRSASATAVSSPAGSCLRRVMAPHPSSCTHAVVSADRPGTASVPA
ncbi:STAS domain-containing protein [Yinghuangia soli]|uniref:STAS domain-containing protein n=1 Tax=Yinghuangia soli TaxID=2908204 RepID=A0AA41PXX8_9ACTN|nr:STAS domain-containing protein [Yinghuangia soli]MCF2527226.1 hypothetical protein [Yinghuangia soli]